VKVVDVHPNLRQLADGLVKVRSYGRYDVNGFQFPSIAFESLRPLAATTNSGVVTRAINDGHKTNYYARNSYHEEFIDFPPHSYSHFLPRFYSRASPRTSARAFPQFSYGPNHRSYGFGPRENHFENRCFGCSPHPHRGDRFLRRPSFPAGGSYTHFEVRYLDGPRFPRRGSHPTRPSGEVQRTVKTSSSYMVKCWIPKIYLTNPSTESSTFSRPV
jgi:hypothetical protein